MAQPPPPLPSPAGGPPPSPAPGSAAGASGGGARVRRRRPSSGGRSGGGGGDADTGGSAGSGDNGGGGLGSGGGGRNGRNSGGRGRGRGRGGNNNGTPSRVVYEEHWTRDAVAAGLARGELFQGALRVNGRRRFQAYATLDGVAADVLFDSLGEQNRGVEGDVVAFRLLPPATWPLLTKEEDDDATETPATPAAADVADDDDDDDADVAEDEEDAADEDVAQTMTDFVTSRAAALQIASPAPPRTPSGTPLPTLPPLPTGDPAAALAAVAAAARGPPARRPLGAVVAIISFSARRETIVGYLEAVSLQSGGGDAASPAAASPATPGGRGRGGRGRGGAATAAAPPSSPLPAAGGVPPATPPPAQQQQQLMWRFMPADARFPRANVQPADVPPEAHAAAAAGVLASLLFTARLTRWAAASPAPLAAVTACLGAACDVDTETAALVAEYRLSDVPFSPEALACLPPTPWRISAAELASRRDLRSARIVSIDPPTARDLDDALSVVPMPGGGARVGVHIADVAHFVGAGSALDAAAAERATSAYLTQRVIPMLPRLLCEQLCSLNPGEDRLAFSCEWELNSEGEVLTEWFGRSVIHSAAKLDYDTAQRVIEAAAAGADVAAPLAGVRLAAPHAAADVAADVLALHTLAQRMRARRFAAGALRLDNTRLFFALGPDGAPLGAAPYVTRQAHQLVEEFMLLANRRVAAAIAAAFPERALLRRHPPPEARKLAELVAFAAAHGCVLDGSSSGALHASLVALRAAAPAVAPLATLLATKPMQLAQYFCTGDVPEAHWRHYALATPQYTHFTSPIRRYADVLVHRLLAAALLQLPATDPSCGRPGGVAGAQVAAAAAAALASREALGALAAHCNERKAAAKAAQEASAKVFLCALLRTVRIATSAHVLATGPKYLHVYLDELGFEARVNLDAAALPQGVAATHDKASGLVALARRAAGGNARRRSGANNAVEAEERPVRALSLGCGAAGSGADTDAAPQPLPPAPLPARVAPFDTVPVLLSATSADGKRSEVVATLYLA